MNNLSSYCGLVDAKIRASDKDLLVPDSRLIAFLNIGKKTLFLEFHTHNKERIVINPTRSDQCMTVYKRCNTKYFKLQFFPHQVSIKW